MFRVHDAINSMASQWPNIHPKCGPFFDKCKPTSQYVHTRQGELPVTSSKHSPNIKRHYHFLSFLKMCVCVCAHTKPTLVFFASYMCTFHLCPCCCCCYHWCCVALHKSESIEKQKIVFTRLTLSLQKKAVSLSLFLLLSFICQIKLKHKLNQYNNK